MFAVMIEDKLKAVFIGSVIGDALGTTLEFSTRDRHPHITDIVGGGVFQLPRGAWTDDTSMSLALAYSLVECKGYNPTDIMDRFLAWRDKGSYSHTGTCFDIGITNNEALTRYRRKQKKVTKAFSKDEVFRADPYCGDASEYSAGNGSIMRISPLIAYCKGDVDLCLQLVVDQSRLTHKHHLCLEYCKKLVHTVHKALQGELSDDILTQKGKHRDKVDSDGFVVNTYNAACWAVANTDNFKDAMLLAVNLAGDADTVGCVTGMIAGALYGLENIPKDWIDCLVWKDEILTLADKLVEV